MKQAKVVFSDIFMTNQYSAVVLQSRIQAFDLPAPPIYSKLAAILHNRLHTVRSVRSDQFNAFRSHLLVQRITIECPISDQPLRSFQDKSRCASYFHEDDFMQRSRRNVDGDMETRAVWHRYGLRTFAVLGFSNCPPPFLATTKKPSMKHSDRSSLSHSFKQLASVCGMFSSTPFLRHSWKRRWQVAGEGYRSGMSCQGAPVRSTHRMPFSMSRFLTLGRPLPSSLVGFFLDER